MLTTMEQINTVSSATKTENGLRSQLPDFRAGTKKWWERKVMERFAIAHLNLSLKEIKEVF